MQKIDKKLEIKKIILATSNKGKKQEFEKVFESLNSSSGSEKQIHFQNIDDGFECEETGNSFLENATQKAQKAASLTGNYCLADDSGTCVKAMDNQPGIYSARFFDEGRGMQTILKETKEKNNKDAFFACCLVLVSPVGEVIWNTEKHWKGTIANSAKGSNGFGYDPIFIPEGYSQTVAELGPSVKNKISHRAQAIQAFYNFMQIEREALKQGTAN